MDHLAVERGHSRNTLAAYRRDLSRYLSWLDAAGITGLDAVTRADVGAFFAHLAAGDEEHRPLAASSVSRVSSVVRGLHTFAVDEGHCLDNPAAELAAPRPPMRLPKAISVDDVERLLDAAAVAEPLIALRDRALLEFLYGTGSRVSEAIECYVDDVDAAAVTLRGKGGKTRVVPLGGYAQRALQAYLVRARPSWTPSHSRLFVNSRGGRLTRQGVFHILRTVADRAGLTGDIGPHTLRHSFATHLLDGGADIRVVQELLGHSAVSTTQIYTLVTVDKLREVYATSHPRAR